MLLSFIVAMSENRCIGRNNHLPWRLPDEWTYFRKVTEGKPFLMGRKSFESPDGLYSDYRNIVISRQDDLPLPSSFELAHSPEQGLELVRNEPEVFVLGGVLLFEELLPRADKLYLTWVHTRIEGDVFFPEIDLSRWELVYTDYHATDEQHAYAFTMNQYIRKEN